MKGLVQGGMGVKGRGVIGVLALVAGTSWAGWSVPAAMAQEGGADAGALGGPKVRDNSVPGQARQFAGGAREKGEPRRLPPMAFARAIASLEGPDAPEGLALSEEQRSQLAAIRDEQREAMKAYVEQHRGEIDALRAHLSERDRARLDGLLDGARARQDGGMGDGGQGKGAMGKRAMEGKGAAEGAKRGEGERGEPSPEELAARQKLRELLEGAPKPEDAQVRAMAVLSGPQQEHVKASLVRAHKREHTRGQTRAQTGGQERGEGRGRMLERLSPEDRAKLEGMDEDARREWAKERLAKRSKGGERGSKKAGSQGGDGQDGEK